METDELNFENASWNQLGGDEQSTGLEDTVRAYEGVREAVDLEAAAATSHAHTLGTLTHIKSSSKATERPPPYAMTLGLRLRKWFYCDLFRGSERKFRTHHSKKHYQRQLGVYQSQAGWYAQCAETVERHNVTLGEEVTDLRDRVLAQNEVSSTEAESIRRDQQELKRLHGERDELLARRRKGDNVDEEYMECLGNIEQTEDEIFDAEQTLKRQQTTLHGMTEMFVTKRNDHDHNRQKIVGAYHLSNEYQKTIHSHEAMLESLRNQSITLSLADMRFEQGVLGLQTAHRSVEDASMAAQQAAIEEGKYLKTILATPAHQAFNNGTGGALPGDDVLARQEKLDRFVKAAVNREDAYAGCRTAV